MTPTEHVDLCPNEGVVDVAECELCQRARTPCWVTQGGRAYHLNQECPALHKRRTHPVLRKTLAAAKGQFSGCEVCVNEVCASCAVGRHHSCNPRQSQLVACRCASRGHGAEERR